MTFAQSESNNPPLILIYYIKVIGGIITPRPWTLISVIVYEAVKVFLIYEYFISCTGTTEIKS